MMNELLASIASGKAILFTGAGFSVGCKNLYKEEPPSASDLAKSICKLGNFDVDSDLRYAADYYLENQNKSTLIDLLKNTYSVSEVSDSQVAICKFNWRRFYTTNYDKTIEIASAKNGKHVECIDLEKSPQDYYKKDGICIHLNGSVDNLTEDSIENGFKLSTSSYISAESFLNSNWFYPFKRDLERCSAIVFVGYSMYDIEIQKVLYEIKELKDKTYFITSKDPKPKSVFTLSKFGQIIPIGTDGFANLLLNNAEFLTDRSNEVFLESFVKYELRDDHNVIRDSNIETMLMYGDIEQSYIENAVLGEQKTPYLILRKELSKVLELSKKNESIIIFSELGNGKSIFIDELLPYLTVNSIDVYTLEDKDGDYLGDIDKLTKNASSRSVVIVDGYEACIDLFHHVSVVSPDNVCVIATSRTSDHERLRSKLKDITVKYNEINIDFLSDEESHFLLSILDNIGLWGDKANLSPELKMKYLQYDNKMQISLALLTLFESPQILKRVSSVVSDLFRNKDYKETIFAISFLEILDIPAESSIISEVAINDTIYNADFRNNKDFKQLFKFSGNRVISKSSLFCLSLIKNHFEASYIMERLQKIAEKFNKHQKNSFKEGRIFKSTLKFSFVERLLPATNKKSNLFRYYEELKISVPWLKNDPHFWLQFGMARIPYKDYPKAQLHFDQAYGLAKNKNGYDVSNIDTQQARLYILKAIDEHDQSASYDLFNKAHRLLSPLDNDVYKFRQAEKYRDYYEAKFNYLSQKNKVNFENACKKILKDIQHAEVIGYINSSEQKVIAKTKDNLNMIIEKITSKRNK